MPRKTDACSLKKSVSGTHRFFLSAVRLFLKRGGASLPADGKAHTCDNSKIGVRVVGSTKNRSIACLHATEMRKKESSRLED